jgi:homoserine dehydrogenase
VRVGLIGWGTIGTGVVKLLRRNRALIRTRIGVPLTLAGIADIDLETDRGINVDRRLLTTDATRLLRDPDIDVIVELVGGYGVARRFVLDAMAAGKSVVTANKALLAVHGEEIFGAAERAGVDLGFEASVGGGIPIIRALRQSLCGDRQRAVYGIVNGTCNYILSTMTDAGAEFDQVLRDAQAAGLAEADPTVDIDGIDSAHKLTLLIQLAFGVRVAFDDVPIEGIRHVSAVDIAFAREFGYVIKLLAIAKTDGGTIEARVHPTMVPRTHLLADVTGPFNAIVVTGEALGPTMYTGQGAGMMPTATAVVADLMEVARNRLDGSSGRIPPLGMPLAALAHTRVKPLDDLVCQYYLRFMVLDRPGVLAQIAGVLGRHDISIASVIQKGREHSPVAVVIRTHEARERNLRRALRAIGKLTAVKGKPAVIRIEDDLTPAPAGSRPRG